MNDVVLSGRTRKTENREQKSLDSLPGRAHKYESNRYFLRPWNYIVQEKVQEGANLGANLSEEEFFVQEFLFFSAA